MDIPKIKDELKEKLNNKPLKGYETERYVIRINHKIFRLKSVKIILIQNLNDKIILLADRPYYIDTFEQVFNEEYNLNLPFIETTDSLF
ncbi:hypothetical protein H8356DRAFT_1430696 [Neocallimastix lanati (nom. inval.)]|nr:hypothetical protein H8356DRAFT_1430696 [Neocallimastix sp. JGI-2020a]